VGSRFRAMPHLRIEIGAPDGVYMHPVTQTKPLPASYHSQMNIAAIAGGLLAVILITPAGHAESFDKPLHKRVLDLGRSQYLMSNDNRHVTVTCSYYSHFMVKEQNDPGVKGAELLALASVQSGHLPKCLQALQPSEKVFTQWSEEYKKSVPWNGYFAGVKHDLIFLEWPDGDDNSGIPFTAFEPDAKTKLFEDSVALEARGERNLNFLPTSPNKIVLRYLRVASAGCSIPKSGEGCWNKLQEQTGLTHSPIPKCSDYEGKEAGMVPSVIAYPVEVSLYPKPSTRPIGGPLRCYPQE
jgi:hypothetical protein